MPDRISAVTGSVHVAATALKTAKDDLRACAEPTPEQVASLMHAALRAATHARALLDLARTLRGDIPE